VRAAKMSLTAAISISSDTHNSRDQRLIPFLGEYLWPSRQPLRAASGVGQTRFEYCYELPSPFARVDHRAHYPKSFRGSRRCFAD
jgi:hypothetical protein